MADKSEEQKEMLDLYKNKILRLQQKNYIDLCWKFISYGIGALFDLLLEKFPEYKYWFELEHDLSPFYNPALKGYKKAVDLQKQIHEKVKVVTNSTSL